MVLFYPSLRITFKLKEPLECLLKNGEVYTIRPFTVKEGVKRVIDGKAKRVIGIARVTKIGKVYLSLKAVKVHNEYKPLKNYVDLSGFKSVHEWIEKLYTVKRNQLYLYRVKLVKILKRNAIYEDV